MNKFRLIFIFLALIAGVNVVAQNTEGQDSLVVLVSSKSAQVVDVDGASYRKVIGPARFLHNDTYLLCDTAYWNVETKVIDAWGNVSILQEETVLTSDKLTYLIDQDLAQFRGSVVQLTMISLMARASSVMLASPWMVCLMTEEATAKLTMSMGL